MAVKVTILAVLLAGLSLSQQAVWASDVALWAQAVRWNPSSPRPPFNLGMALRKAGRVEESVPWFLRAVDRSAGSLRETEYRARVKAQLEAVEMTGYLICHLAEVQPYC